MKVELTEGEVQNLQAYLDYLITGETEYNKGLKTDLMRQDVARLMNKIRDQTGIGLLDVMPTGAKPVVPEHVCAWSIRDNCCLICGETNRK